ncbi:hypothetical protein GALL_501990 [mine drainage metagenome]|uniref:Uncharacterized protein n=1 Tax=mine drainage metagenome TaxID=410659 RepID=A0A1J5PAG8_9ZZZZ
MMTGGAGTSATKVTMIDHKAAAGKQERFGMV